MNIVEPIIIFIGTATQVYYSEYLVTVLKKLSFDVNLHKKKLKTVAREIALLGEKNPCHASLVELILFMELVQKSVCDRIGSRQRKITWKSMNKLD